MKAIKTAAPQLLPKIATGIPGFDELSHGGLPRNRTTLLKGGPGSGKTVFALQSLVNAIRRRPRPRTTLLKGGRGWGKPVSPLQPLVNAIRRRQEPGIFVAFEESPRQISAN